MDPQSVFGDKIANPLSDTFTQSYGDLNGVGGAGGGLIGFVSNLLKFITVVGGIWVVFNLVIAGFMYITNNDDPKATVLAWQKIYMSLIGLVIMAAAFIITAILGYILFGDPSVILNPKVYGPGVN